MTPHRTTSGPGSTFDRRGSDRPDDDDVGEPRRRHARWNAIYSSRFVRTAVVLGGAGGMLMSGLSSLGFLSSTPSSRISALSTVVSANSLDISHNSRRVDSLGRAVDTRFDSLDDRLTFMSYLLCKSSANLTQSARLKCDTIIQRRLNP